MSQPQIIIGDGAYMHEQSGIQFPMTIGDFQRGIIQRYDHDGLDVSVGYNLRSANRAMIATVYVYPSPIIRSIGSPAETAVLARAHLAKEDFVARTREILEPRPGARLIEETEVLIPIGGTLKTGMMATFEYNELFLGKRRLLRSHLYLFNYVGGKWALKYRITYPSHLETTREIDAVLQGVPWNVPKE